ncbi:MAG: hypothetical protein ACFFA3_16620 [Promethearchaeota archaeon]
MKELKSVLKAVILLFLLILSYFVLYNFFYYNQHHVWYSFTVNANWMITITFFIFFFFTLLFLIDFNHYITIFNILVPFGTFVWIGIYLLEIFKIDLGVWNWSMIRHSAAVLSMAILSPGLNLYIIKYIRNNSNPKRKRKIIRNYHVHEGFVGIIFVIIALILWFIRLIMIQYEILRKQLRIFLAVEMILLFLFLFSGSFLVIRDRRDVVRLKFIEKRQDQVITRISPIFNQISQDSLQFFKFPRGLYYPFGILLNSIALNMFIHGTDFLPNEIFNLHHEVIVLIGVILCFIAGGMIGLDWYRLFSKLYPQLYHDLEQILDDFRTKEVV